MGQRADLARSGHSSRLEQPAARARSKASQTIGETELTIYQIREIPNENRVVVEFYQGEMETHPMADFASLATAQAAYPQIIWKVLADEDREADEIGGDVLAIGI